MKPIINPWLFYLVDVIGNFKSSCFVLLLIVVIGFGATVLIEIGETADELELDTVKVIKTLKRMAVVGVLLMTLNMLLPSKKTCYQMMIASQVTEENVKKAEDVIKDSVDYIFEKINTNNKGE
jgi:hypothetical protein